MPQQRTAGEAKRKRSIEPLFIFKGKFDIPFFILVMILLTVGLIMLFSASHAYAFYYLNNSYQFIGRQIMWAVAGIIVMLAVSFFNYKYLRYFAYLLYGVSVVLLMITYFMPPINNARRWIVIGSFQFQPSEIAKFAIILLFAHLICKYQDKMKTFRYGILPFLAYLGVIAGLMVFQPHMSGTILILSIGIVMMFVGGTNVKLMGLLGAGGVSALAALVLFTGKLDHVMVRIEHWIDPFSDALGDGFQTIQSLYAIGSGGLFGVGLGESRQKYMYLPEVQNDFVFSIVCEELGFIGAVAVILLFALLVWRGFSIAMKARDRFGSLLVVGVTTQVGLQAMLNIAVVTNTVPNTGISLPFFSYGGTALLVMLAQMGVILSVSRQINYEKE